MNFYPFHIGDYISHTSHLSDIEDLTYRRMIDLYYLSEQPFVNPVAISRKIKAPVKIVKALLAEFYTFENDAWHSKRADIEIEKYQFLKESGKKGAEKRWKNAGVMVTQCVPNSPPIANPIATKTKTKTITNIKTITPVGFDLFWNAYNKKIGKPNAIKQWLKIKPSDDLVQTIVSKALADAAAKPDAKFRKDPERWLKGKHWEDEVIVAMPLERTELPLGSDQQIETAYRLECGGDPRQSRFNSYHEMRKFVIDHREKQRVRA